MLQNPPSTRSAPSTAASWSGASMPFWSGTTNVRSRTSGRRDAAASGTCQAFTPRRTTSTGPTSADGQAVLPQGGQVRPAGDEPDLLPRLGEAPAEVAAGGAGAEHGDGELCHACAFDSSRRTRYFRRRSPHQHRLTALQRSCST
jgi:hypothetical protein